MVPRLGICAVVLVLALAVAEPLGWRHFVSQMEHSLRLADESIIADLRSVPSEARVVVVPGYRLLGDGTPSPLLARRIAVAVKLAAVTRANLILSGGVPPALPNTSEARAMLDYARMCHGDRLIRIPRIFLENASRTTRENAIMSSQLLMQHVHRSSRHEIQMAVVTNEFHQARACRVFARAAQRSSGIKTHCSPVPGSLSKDIQALVSKHKVSSPASAAATAHHGSRAAACNLELETAVSSYEVLWLVLREFAAMVKYGVLGWL
jgi:vancomycin permeability regulator SanA